MNHPSGIKLVGEGLIGGFIDIGILTPVKRAKLLEFRPLKRHNSSSTEVYTLPRDIDFTFSTKSQSPDLESLPDLTEDESDITDLSIVTSTDSVIDDDFTTINKNASSASSQVFEIPEILNNILFFVDSNYYNCLLVNKLFHNITSSLISKNIKFDNELKLANYLNSSESTNFKPDQFTLSKLFRTKQSAIEKLVDKIDCSNLITLEFFMCPKLAPVASFLTTTLTTLVITGSKIVDDDFLSLVSEKCPNLKSIDLRACDLISDAGIYQIAKNCHQLTLINFGRKVKGNLVTDNSISKLIFNNPKLVTVGLAGCHISDKIIWDLAMNCPDLQRLSLNNCPLILDRSIPLILSRQHRHRYNYFENLSVLELRSNLNITNWLPIVEFKRNQEYRGISVLINTCDVLKSRLKQQEIDIDRMISKRIFMDILGWANDEDDGDASYKQFMESRKSK